MPAHRAYDIRVMFRLIKLKQNNLRSGITVQFCTWTFLYCLPHCVWPVSRGSLEERQIEEGELVGFSALHNRTYICASAYASRLILTVSYVHANFKRQLQEHNCGRVVPWSWTESSISAYRRRVTFCCFTKCYREQNRFVNNIYNGYLISSSKSFILVCK